MDKFLTKLDVTYPWKQPVCDRCSGTGTVHGIIEEMGCEVSSSWPCERPACAKPIARAGSSNRV